MKLEIPDGWTIDHIDRDKFNNQRSNFRPATLRLQRYNTDKKKNNTSGFLGVSFQKECTIHPWAAKIQMPDGKYKHLGTFKDPKEASLVYQAAKKIRDDAEIKRCKEL